MPPNRRTTTANPENQNTGNQNPVDLIMTQILQLLQQQTAALAQQRPTQPIVTFKTFHAMHPPEFKGTVNPIEARGWLIEMEKAFALVRVGEDQKTKYASYFLKAEANHWWESTKLLEGEGVITWQRFTELFLEKYLPRYMQDQLEIQFLGLKQENMSVAEYEAKFTVLARFVPEYVNTEAKKAKRFQQGLKSWIRSKVAVFQLENYAMVVEKATIVEGESELYQKEKARKKRKIEATEGSQNPRGNHNNSKFKPRNEGQFDRSRGFQKPKNGNGGQGKRFQNTNQQLAIRPALPECTTCGKKHSGVCHRLSITCFKCNKKGHYARECPTSKPGITCYNCGKIGHIAKDCKEPVQTAKALRIVEPPSANALRIVGPPTQTQIYPPRARTFNMMMHDAVQEADVVADSKDVDPRGKGKAKTEDF